MRSLFLIIVVCVCLLQTSCQIKPPTYNTPLDEGSKLLQEGIKNNVEEQQQKADKTLPIAIKNTLFPKVGDSDTAHNTLYGKRFTLNVSNIAAPLFFDNLRKGTPYNITVDPKISGTISLNLQNVTVPQIFEALRDNYGYEFTQTTYGFSVYPPKMQMRLFRVNYLDISRSSSSVTSVASSDLTDAGTADYSSNGTAPAPAAAAGSGKAPLVTNSVQTSATLDFWTSLSDNLKNLVGTDGGRSVTVNAISGVVMVKAYPSELRQVSDFLDRIQSNMNRQVILEVSILEVQLNDAFQSGINWKLLGLQTSMGAAGVADILPYTTITATDGSNSALVNLLQAQGTVQVLSNPRVLTVNNQQSVIKVGSENFYVTSVTTVPTSVSGSTSTTSSSSVGMTPFFSGITLDITPQIDYNSEVMLHVHPSISVVKQEEKTINLGTSGIMTLPTASESLREYDSIVRASNNQIIVIGGMISNALSESVSGTPGISKIPFLGTLFRSNTQVANKVELVIVVKPLLVSEHPQELRDEFNATRKGMMSLNRGFHQGGITDMMGNQAEGN